MNINAIFLSINNINHIISISISQSNRLFPYQFPTSLSRIISTMLECNTY